MNQMNSNSSTHTSQQAKKVIYTTKIKGIHEQTALLPKEEANAIKGILSGNPVFRHSLEDTFVRKNHQHSFPVLKNSVGHED
jgi:hypothetical protein